MGDNIKIGEEFKPSPQFKKLCYIYLTFGFILAVLWWYLPLLIFASFKAKIITSVPILGALIFIVYWIWDYYNSMIYKLTENEIIWKRGIWFRKTGIVPYNRITNIDIVQGPISRMLGIATINIQTAGYSGQQAKPEIRIEGIERFEELKDLIIGFVKGKKPVAVESYDKDNIDLKILNELIKIRKLLEKSSENR